jgi:hypothetical protein
MGSREHRTFPDSVARVVFLPKGVWQLNKGNRKVQLLFVNTSEPKVARKRIL